MLSPKQLRNFGQGLILVGFASFLGAVVWWYRFYSDALRDDVKMASECFYRTTSDCNAGNYVISLVSDLPAYRPELLWAACIVMIAGLTLVITQHEDPPK